MSYLKIEDYAAWTVCPGRPALEESEGGRLDTVPKLSQDERRALNERRDALAGTGAVEVMALQSLPVGDITTEKGALAWGSVIIAESETGSRLEVYPPDKTLALAALLKFGILHEFNATNCGTPAELYEHGQKVTEAAALALSLRNSITALEHLKPGEYCKTCLAAYRCPALRNTVHATVFPLQAPDDEDLTPVVPSVGGDEWARVLARLPLVETWVDAVRDRRSGLESKATRAVKAPKKKRRKRRAKRVIASSPS